MPMEFLVTANLESITILETLCILCKNMFFTTDHNSFGH